MQGTDASIRDQHENPAVADLQSECGYEGERQEKEMQEISVALAWWRSLVCFFNFVALWEVLSTFLSGLPLRAGDNGPCKQELP